MSDTFTSAATYSKWVQTMEPLSSPIAVASPADKFDTDLFSVSSKSAFSPLSEVVEFFAQPLVGECPSSSVWPLSPMYDRPSFDISTISSNV